jgi:DnaJ-class molecular chaperone
MEYGQIRMPIGHGTNWEIALTQACWECSGLGVKYGRESEDKRTCDRCEGKAMLATEAGEAILQLLKEFGHG